MNKTAAIIALVSFLSVPVGASFAGTTASTTPSQTSSSRASSPPSAPPPRTASTSFGTFNSAPKQAAAPAPAPKPTPAVAVPAPVQKSTAFGTTGNVPSGKSADPAPSKSVSAMSADLTKSTQQKSAIDSWDNRNRVANTAPTGVNRDNVLPDSDKRRIESPVATPPQGDRSLAIAREQAYREQQARREQQRVEELRIERLREERRLELARMERERQRASVNGGLVTGVAVGSVLAHDRQPTVAAQESVPASPARDDRQLQHYEAPQSSQDESSGFGFFWFFAIVLAAAAFGGVYWFLNRKPASAGSGFEQVRRKSNYDLK